MKGPTALLRALLFGTATLVATAPVAWAQNYSYEILVSSGDVIDGVPVFNLAPTRTGPLLNNSGVVQFGGDFGPGVNDRAAFTQNAVLHVVGDEIGGLVVGGANSRAFNDVGTLIFSSSYTDPVLGKVSGLFTQHDPLLLSGDVVDGLTLVTVAGQGFAAAGISSAGNHISYFSLFDGGEGIFRDSSLVARDGDIVGGHVLSTFSGGFTLFTGVNEAGRVAYYASTDDGQGVFTDAGVVAHSGDVVDGRELTTIGTRVLLNEAGNVFYFATFSGSDRGIFVDDRLILARNATLADGTVVNHPDGATDVNDEGVVVFAGNLAGDGRIALLTQNGLVAALGDEIAPGKTLAFGSFANSSINNQGEVAFLAHFEDGGQSIVLARPGPTSQLDELIAPRRLNPLR